MHRHSPTDFVESVRSLMVLCLTLGTNGYISRDITMTYNHPKILQELDMLVSRNPRIQLSEISSRLGMNRHTIERAVLTSKKMSFREYRTAHLLQRATWMLKESGLTVKQIGAGLGYPSLSSFCRFVHRSTGKSPCQLRRENGNGTAG